MYERRKKPTLEQMRTLYHFDMSALATTARVDIRVVYSAMLLHPVSKSDAEKIIRALSQHIGLELSFDQLDIVIWEESLVLWLIRASADANQQEHHEIADEYHFVYARDQKQAAILAHEWLEQFPHLPHHHFTACPYGFKIGDIYVPGRQVIEHDEPIL